MEWQFIVALIIAVPIILFPAAFMWYVNAGRLIQVLKSARKSKASATVVTYKQAHAYHGK